MARSDNGGYGFKPFFNIPKPPIDRQPHSPPQALLPPAGGVPIGTVDPDVQSTNDIMSNKQLVQPNGIKISQIQGAGGMGGI